MSFTNVTAVLSMVHEAPDGAAGGNSATRLFRANPVLHWTLERTSRATRVGSAATSRHASRVATLTHARRAPTSTYVHSASTSTHAD